MTRDVLLIKRLRESGNVERVHTIPHHGSYSDGKHSFDALTLLLVLHPDPSVNLIKAVLWHDSAERYIGDAPTPAKRFCVEFGEVYNQLDDEVLCSHFDMAVILGSLTATDRAWLHGVDAIEFWLWCKDQENLGNRNVVPAFRNISEYINLMVEKGRLPEPCIHFLREHTWERLPDINRSDK